MTDLMPEPTTEPVTEPTVKSKSLRELQPILNFALRLCAKSTAFHCHPPLREILRSHRQLVVAVNHSTPLSWLPASALLVASACASGGEDRIPIGIMDRFFFQVPLFREVASFVTQTNRALSFCEIVKRFEAKQDFDLVVFPEGSNCFFGQVDELQDFRSPKFIEIAVRTASPILVVAHLGSENWARSIQVPPAVLDAVEYLPSFARQFLEKRLRETRKLVVPLWPAPMAKFEMSCELYRPSIDARDLSDDPSERRRQLELESQRVRKCMERLLRDLRGERRPASLSSRDREAQSLRVPTEVQLELFPI